LYVCEEVLDFFASLRLECGELSRDSHVSTLVLTVRTAVSRLQSLLWTPRRSVQSSKA